MGLFSFINEAGSKLGGKIHDLANNEEEKKAQAKAAADVALEQYNASRVSSILDNINETGIAVESLKVEVDQTKVTINGQVDTQECSEKVTLVAGNQHGVSEVDCQLQVKNPQPEAQFYTVKAGDNLSKIAKEFYGNASKYQLIFEANKPMLDNPDKIFVGQSLRIPAQ